MAGIDDAFKYLSAEFSLVENLFINPLLGYRAWMTYGGFIFRKIEKVKNMKRLVFLVALLGFSLIGNVSATYRQMSFQIWLEYGRDHLRR
jgi:hypothetical protein